MTSSQMETLPLSPPVDPPTETEIAAEEPANGFPDDVKEIWVYKRHIQTSTKHGGHDSCFIVKRNTVDHKMYLSGPPSYKKVPVQIIRLLHHLLYLLLLMTTHTVIFFLCLLLLFKKQVFLNRMTVLGSPFFFFFFFF